MFLTELDLVERIWVNFHWDLGHKVSLVRNVTLSCFEKFAQPSDLLRPVPKKWGWKRPVYIRNPKRTPERPQVDTVVPSASFLVELSVSAPQEICIFII